MAKHYKAKRVTEPGIEPLNRDRVLALMGEQDGMVWEAHVDGEWLPIGRLLTWGEFSRGVLIRMVEVDHG